VKTVEQKISVPVKVEKPVTGYDLDKLAKAVAIAETSDCTKGRTAVARNNCFGIMHWPNGVRTLKTYPTKEASYKDFERVWSSYYGRFPDSRLAHKWTGGDRPDDWLRIVTSVYNSL
jgi:hypothetical protein